MAPSLPKIPPAGPAIVPKQLQPAPPVPAVTATATLKTTSAKATGIPAWLRRNGLVLVLNFGSICTLAGFTRKDVLELRAGNLCGNLCAMTYFGLSRPVCWPPLVWSSVFGSTNAYNIYLILEERSDKVVLSREEEAIYVEHFLPHGLTPQQFSRLMAKSSNVHVPEGQVVVRQGDPMKAVFLVCRGRTYASVLGRHLTYASSLPGNHAALKGGDSGAWIGEIAFLEAFWQKEHTQRKRKRTRSAAAAVSSKVNRSEEEKDVESGVDSRSECTDKCRALHTIIATERSELRSWTHEDLEEVMKTSSDMRAAMTRAMTAAVVGKVVNFTVSSSQNGTPSWSSWLKEGLHSNDANVTVTKRISEAKKAFFDKNMGS